MDLPQAVAQGPIRKKPLPAACKCPSLGRDHLGAAVAEREGDTELWGAVRPSAGAAGIPGGGRSASEPSGKDARDEMAAGAGGAAPAGGTRNALEGGEGGREGLLSCPSSAKALEPCALMLCWLGARSLQPLRSPPAAPLLAAGARVRTVVSFTDP